MRAQRFTRAMRLRCAEEFTAVLRNAPAARTAALKMARLPAGERRLGLVAGRGVGTAPTRNRLKRGAREHFRLHPELYGRGHYVVIFFPAAAALTNAELRTHLARALQKLNERCHPSQGGIRCHRS